MMTENNNSQLIIYQTETGETKIDVRFQDETVWLSQQLIAELFQTTVPNVNMHVKNIFEEGELSKKATIKDFLIVQKEGSRQVRRKVEYYNLDMIISGKISHQLAMETANKEYEKYSKKRQIAHDEKGNAFDALVGETKKIENKKGKKKC